MSTKEQRRSSLLDAFIRRSAVAKVVDVEHYPIQGGVAVGTDYIVEVKSAVTASSTSGKDGEGGGEFGTFSLSKTYSSFRTLSDQLKKIMRDAARGGNIWGSKKNVKKEERRQTLSKGVQSSIELSECLSKVIHSENYRYLGKINYGHVKAIAKKRKVLIDEALNVILTKFPTTDLDAPDVAKLTSAIENFFLTDHVSPDAKSAKKKADKAAETNEPATTTTKTERKPADDGQKPKDNPESNVIAKTVKPRRSVVIKERDDKSLETIGYERGLTLEDEVEDIDALSSSSSGGAFREKFDNPATFALAFLTGVYALRSASYSTITVTIDTDVALVAMFALFCLGLHFPRSEERGASVPATETSLPPVPFEDLAASGVLRSVHGGASVLIRRSMKASRPPLVTKSMRELRASAASSAASIGLLEEDIEDHHYLDSPLPVFPEGAKLGSQFNCWSEPEATTFKVRGPDYLKDRKKIESGSFIFPIRAVDLFLTDLCPENVGSINGVLGGKLREKPTFILNFRMPWGVLLFYAEIPSKFLPFLRKRYDPSFDAAPLPSLDKWTPGDRSVARFLMGDDKHKDETLKIVPVAVKAPWIVKSVVGGKPAIIGTKMPVSYVYQPAEPESKKSEYLEVDFDIVASAAARQILSITSSYTNVLTLDLGFLVEGTTEDELPEQMLCAARLHGIDAASAPPLPATDDMFA